MVLAEGANSFTATASDGVNTSAVSGATIITLDTIAPSIPAITTPSGTTNVTPTTIDGTGDIGSIIELFNGASSLGNQTADGSGDWQFTNVVLAEGANSFTATASDGINTSAASGATIITLDTVMDLSPHLTIIKDPINDNGGNAAPDDFSLTVGGNPVSSGVTNTFTANTTLAIDETQLTGYEFVSITGHAKCPASLGGTITLDEGDNITCTITNDDIPSCVVPESGDWTISSDCILRTSNVAPGNVTVENNAVFTIPSDVTLDIDFANFHLIIQSGGGVLIKAGGLIT